MDSKIKRAIGFLLYYKEKTIDRTCGFCVRVGELGASDICAACLLVKSLKQDKPNWREEKTSLLKDWYERKDGLHEKDWPWEQTLTVEALALLKDVEGKVFTPDEVVEIVKKVVRAILTTPTQRIETMVTEIFTEAGIALKKKFDEFDKMY